MKDFVAGVFTAVGQVSGELGIRDFATLALSGSGVGEVTVECRLDRDEPWLPYLGWGAGLTEGVVQSTVGVQVLWMPEPGTRFRLRCSALTSGPIGYRLCNAG